MKKNLVQKLVLVLLAGSMMVSMTACSGSSSNTSKADDSKKSEASEISNSTNNSDVITGGWENNSGALAIQSNAEAKEAFEKTGVSRSGICNCCKGKIKTAGGYIWKYADK